MMRDRDGSDGRFRDFSNQKIPNVVAGFVEFDLAALNRASGVRLARGRIRR